MRRRLLAMLLATGALASGCDDFLGVDPRFGTRDDFPVDSAHMEQASVQVYSSLRNMVGEDYRILGDLRADLTTFQINRNVRDDIRPIEELNELSTDETVRRQYQAIFRTIFDANSVLDRIDGIAYDAEARRTQLRAEAKVARALSYWLALQLWGTEQSWEPDNLAVPLILTELRDPNDAFGTSRATVKQVFDQIVKDLTEAKPGLPLRAAQATADIGRFHQAFATFLLGATYQLDPSTASQEAALAQYVELATMGRSLITAGNAASSNNAFRHVFNPANKNNAESLFEIQYNVTQDDNFLFSDLRQNLNPDHSPLNALGGGPVADPSRVPVFGDGGNGRFLPTPNHVLSFAGANPASSATPFDLRYRGGYGAFCPGSGTSGRLGAPDALRTAGGSAVTSPNTAYPEVNIASLRDPVTTPVATRTNCIAYYTKWRWPEAANMPIDRPGRDNNNFIVFRYADALLRRAEVLTRLGRASEALPFINQVRTRAGLPNLTGLSGQALLDAILQERAWELAGEGHRWLDLKRFGKAVEVIGGAHAADRQARLPASPATNWLRGGQDFRLRLPIPPRDVSLTNCLILQNPGWGGCMTN